MVKHVVMWKLRQFESDGERQEAIGRIRDGLQALVGVVPGLMKLEVGVNFAANGFDLCLYSELDNRAALEGYQKHPEHLKVREFVHTAIVERTVCDWESA